MPKAATPQLSTGLHASHSRYTDLLVIDGLTPSSPFLPPPPVPVSPRSANGVSTKPETPQRDFEGIKNEISKVQSAPKSKDLTSTTNTTQQSAAEKKTHKIPKFHFGWDDFVSSMVLIAIGLSAGLFLVAVFRPYEASTPIAVVYGVLRCFTLPLVVLSYRRPVMATALKGNGLFSSLQSVVANSVHRCLCLVNSTLWPPMFRDARDLFAWGALLLNALCRILVGVEKIQNIELPPDCQGIAQRSWIYITLGWQHISPLLSVGVGWYFFSAPWKDHGSICTRTNSGLLAFNSDAPIEVSKGKRFKSKTNPSTSDHVWLSLRNHTVCPTVQKYLPATPGLTCVCFGLIACMMVDAAFSGRSSIENDRVLGTSAFVFGYWRIALRELLMHSLAVATLVGAYYSSSFIPVKGAEWARVGLRHIFGAFFVYYVLIGSRRFSEAFLCLVIYVECNECLNRLQELSAAIVAEPFAQATRDMYKQVRIHLESVQCRMHPVLVYLCFDRIVYMLSDLRVSDLSVASLVMRHVVYTALATVVLVKIAAVNTQCEKQIPQDVNEAMVACGNTDEEKDRRNKLDQWATHFRTSTMPLGLKILNIAPDKKMIAGWAVSTFWPFVARQFATGKAR